MRILITGADGFLGRCLVGKLLAAGRIAPASAPFTSLVLMDLHMERLIIDPRVRTMTASFTDADARSRALAGGIDVLFHLASVPGGAAQRDFELGRSVNLDGPIALMDAMCVSGGRPPIVVNTSSIAAIGPPRDEVVTEDTPLRPRGSYGSHKLMLEIYLADLSARGWIDARSVRPAGIVPRPRSAFAGFATAWMSDVFHAMARGEPFEVPMAADATTWLQSVDCVADNLLHAAALPAEGLPEHRAWTLPALAPTMRDLVQAIGAQTSPDHAARVSFGVAPANAPGAGLPPQRLPLTQALGFHHDGSLAEMVRRTLAAVRLDSAQGVR